MKIPFSLPVWRRRTTAFSLNYCVVLMHLQLPQGPVRYPANISATSKRLEDVSVLQQIQKSELLDTDLLGSDDNKPVLIYFKSAQNENRYSSSADVCGWFLGRSVIETSPSLRCDSRPALNCLNRFL